MTAAHRPADTSEPVRETAVGGVLREAAADTPDGLAMVAGLPDPADRRRWTFAELLADAERAPARWPPGSGRVSGWRPGRRTCRSGSSWSTVPPSPDDIAQIQ